MTNIKPFAESLRRTMYLLKMLTYEVDFMRDLSPANKLTQGLKIANCNLTNQIRSIKGVLNEEARTYVDQELSKEQLMSLANIIHLLADIENVEEFEDEIKRIVDEAINIDVEAKKQAV